MNNGCLCNRNINLSQNDGRKKIEYFFREKLYQDSLQIESYIVLCIEILFKLLSPSDCLCKL